MNVLDKLKPDVELLEDTARFYRLKEVAVVEKDVYVTYAIQQLAPIETEHFRLVFAGGTCLAKAHRVVQRSSEDVDFKVICKSRQNLSTSALRKHLRELRNSVVDAIKQAGFELPEAQIRARNNGKYTYFNLEYPTQFERNAGLRPHILMELNLSELRTQTVDLPVRTLIDEAVDRDQQKTSAISVKCISILEAAAEKWVALTRRIGAVERGHDRPDPSLIRHLYDLNAIAETNKFDSSFAELVNAIILQDKEQFKNQFIEYQEDPVLETQRSLSALLTESKYEMNYNDFVQTMVFSGQGPEYNKAILAITKLSNLVFDKFAANTRKELIVN